MLDLQPASLSQSLAVARQFRPFQLLQLQHFNFWWSPPENSASYGSAGLVCALPYREWGKAVLKKHVETTSPLREHECSRAQALGACNAWGRATSITWRQYEFNSEHRQQRLKEIQGSEWVLILSWLSALLLLGATWWAAFRLLCCIVQLIQYVPRSLP